MKEMPCFRTLINLVCLFCIEIEVLIPTWLVTSDSALSHTRGGRRGGKDLIEDWNVRDDRAGRRRRRQRRRRWERSTRVNVGQGGGCGQHGGGSSSRGGCNGPRRSCIQQSANMLGDHCVHWRWEWGTMAAAVGHLVTTCDRHCGVVVSCVLRRYM